MIETWSDYTDFMIRSAEDDLAVAGQIRPLLVACIDDEPLLVAWWRPFEKGQYADPFIELIALALPAGATRLAISMGGRVWSVNDPIVPAVPEGDLRQRALIVHDSDGHSALHPFDVDDDEQIRWLDPVVEPSAGWLSDAVKIAAEPESRRQMKATPEAIVEQLTRCVSLGHEVAIHENFARRLEET